MLPQDFIGRIFHHFRRFSSFYVQDGNMIFVSNRGNVSVPIDKINEYYNSNTKISTIVDEIENLLPIMIRS